LRKKTAVANPSGAFGPDLRFFETNLVIWPFRFEKETFKDSQGFVSSNDI